MSFILCVLCKLSDIFPKLKKYFMLPCKKIFVSCLLHILFVQNMELNTARLFCMKKEMVSAENA